jgi:hypothetical protein
VRRTRYRDRSEDGGDGHHGHELEQRRPTLALHRSLLSAFGRPLEAGESGEGYDGAPEVARIT